MFTGIFAGITWALETVILGIALGMSPFVSTQEAVVLAPFVSTFLHDLFSALFMLVYNAGRGNLRSLSGVFRNADFKWLILASAIGGPVGKEISPPTESAFVIDTLPFELILDKEISPSP